MDIHEGNFRYFTRKFSNGINHIRQSHEKINRLNWKQKLAFAFGIELFFDSCVVLSHAISGAGNSMTALARTPVQAIAFLGGLQTGRGWLYVKDYAVRSKEEKELDYLGRELTADGKLLQLVSNYRPTKDLIVEVIDSVPSSEEPTGEKIRYTPKQIGEKVGGTILEGCGGIEDGLKAGLGVIKRRIEERRQAEIDRKAADTKRIQDKLKDF